MANEEHLRILKEGVKAWNKWRSECEDIPDLCFANLENVDLNGADLSHAGLSHVNLRGSNLSAAILVHADLSAANLDNANLRGADLRGVNLGGADLNGADLSGSRIFDGQFSNTHLRGADLGRADLSGANFRSTDLRGTNLTGARLYYTNFGNCDLRMVRGLDSVEHSGPSTIGIDTIYKSESQIPDEFLRGCGVPESFILQMRALIGAEDGMQFHSCFISYSHKDEEFAKRLHERMRAANLRVWYAPEDMKGGAKIHEQIETQIHVHDKLLLVLSEYSMASEWVATEVYHTRQREKKEGRQILFPIRLCPFEKIREWKCFDADTGKDMAREIREYLIPDFSNWKDHDRFEANFAKLLRDLRNSEKP